MSPRTPLRWLLASAILASQALATPLVIGHRGTGSTADSNPYPENSLSSIRAAFEEGAGLVEIDVQLAAGGVPVLWHDKYVEVDGEKYRPEELHPDEYPVLQGGGGVVDEVPTFRDALRLALQLAPHPRAIDVEIKISWDEQRAPLVAAVSDVIREELAGRRVMISSFDEEALAAFEQELPGVETGLLGVWKGGTLRAAKKLVAAGSPVEWVIPSKWAPWSLGEDADVGPALAKYIRQAHAAGFRVGVWTVNSADDIADHVADGYDGIITDEPNVGREVIPGQGLLPFAD